MKYSRNFERDWKFYTDNLSVFNFAGKLPPSTVLSRSGPGAKECFYIHDSTGVLNACAEPKLLEQALICKASVNLHIKLWAYGIAHGTFGEFELRVYLDSLQAPDWVMKAVVEQTKRLCK